MAAERPREGEKGTRREVVKIGGASHEFAVSHPNEVAALILRTAEEIE
jgi:hypothetical protein